MGVVSMKQVSIGVSTFDGLTSWVVLDNEKIVVETGNIRVRFKQVNEDNTIDMLFERYPNASVLLEGEPYKTPNRLELEKALMKDYITTRCKAGNGEFRK